jgi:hypothetical protein
MHEPLRRYYQCPERCVSIVLKGPLSGRRGYFKFGKSTLYGNTCGDQVTESPTNTRWDALAETHIENGSVHLPFDLAESLDNLRYERYRGHSDAHPANSFLGKAYYFVRPALSVGVRRHLQKQSLNGWNDLKFPHWPVDRTVDEALENLMLLALRARGGERIPFIWFWPNGASTALVVTHDVETALGRDFCENIMDLDDASGIKASFQVVPEKRYKVSPAYIDSIWNRGFEVAVQDLNHDGRLYRDRKTFLERVGKINRYGQQYGASGFRSAVLYRNQEWFDALDFSYDMSVPNVAHLDPQRGGCCTVMPYFVGKIVELPVTTTQDYSLFHILHNYSIDFWKQQIELIMEKHGLINMIIHPDYVTTPRERKLYEQLLAYIVELRAQRNAWVALPKDVDQWWRLRAEMEIVECPDGLRIKGRGSERARIAWASERDSRLVIEIDTEEDTIPARNQTEEATTFHESACRL